MTPIQKKSLLATLCGRDVLGAAKTGSGKTLAFLIPVLEKLYLESWSVRDGLGALILSPTRELALQTFEVLRRIGAKHSLSAGLVIGGKDLKSERDAIARMNILVATPGRLLQHMDQATGFEWGNLQILVLDEADRILDLGFTKTMDAIIKSLPKTRQTMLFSATQNDSIKTLARVSLYNPVHVSMYSGDEGVTPSKLKQQYCITSLPDKLDRLFSFIKGNLHGRSIVFLSSCKQVRFVYESFCKLQPGVPLLCLHGKQKQVKRMSIFYDFCQKHSAVLFCTDIAARGLDFPSIDWVVQVDCPEDVDTYIHRVGRTARYESEGSSLLFLLPSEAPVMTELLTAKNIPITAMNPDSRLVKPRWNLTGHLQTVCAADPEMKYLAQKSLISYVRSIYLQGNKKVFKVNELPLDDFARSLGLPGTPKVRFMNKQLDGNHSKEESESESESEEESDSQTEQVSKKPTPVQSSKTLDKMFKKKNPTLLSEHYAKLRGDTEESNKKANEEDDLFTLKRTNHQIGEEDIPLPTGPSDHQSRRDALKTKKRYRLKMAAKDPSLRPQKFVFNDDGDAEEAFPYAKESEFDRQRAPEMATEYAQESLAGMQKIDGEDKQRERDRLRAKKMKKKRSLREAANDGEDGDDGDDEFRLPSDQE